MSDTTVTLRRKIDSAGDLQSVVRAMRASAAASVGQYTQAVLSLADYDRTVELALGLCFRHRSASIADVAPPADPGRLVAIVFGSDQGLVGQFNDVVADYAVTTLAKVSGKARFWAVGERAYARLQDSGVELEGTFPAPNSVLAITQLVGQILAEACVESDHLYVVHNHLTTGTQYEPTSRRLLPLDTEWQRDVAKVPWPTSKLPDIIGGADDALPALVREYLFISLFKACAESLCSENASRLAAMQRAENNIDDLMTTLHRKFHQKRQAGIDEELFDLIAGFEALARP